MKKQIAGKKESKQKVYRIMTTALLYMIRIGNSFNVKVQQRPLKENQWITSKF